jgi:ATP-binding cassette, subfamily A (ABC1), member 3
MFADFWIYGFLFWYLNQVFPSEFGTPKPLYFFLLPSYWISCGKGILSCFCGSSTRRRNFDYTTVRDSTREIEMTSAVEPVTENLAAQVEAKTCVEIKGLYKAFQTNTGTKVAVDHLSLTMYSGQITALLGHNGAGKTTAISILTGLIPADGGDALIEGLSINDDMDEIRKNLGVCPQHDILYPDLTVQEHLVMFAAFKGCPRNQIPEEVEKMIQSVGLTEKRNVYSQNLSGGQKRKLSLANAFVGGSRVVFLDEPTSGMDPYSRRFTWNVIRQHREGRVVVLTTHFMDEADLLGDRIAIMGDGRLLTCGSSLYLKR